jgi:hypothetical protein
MCDDDFDWEDMEDILLGYFIGSDRPRVPKDEELDNDFYEPAPGEEDDKPRKPGVRDNGDGSASFTGVLIGMGF